MISEKKKVDVWIIIFFKKWVLLDLYNPVTGGINCSGQVIHVSEWDFLCVQFSVGGCSTSNFQWRR